MNYEFRIMNCDLVVGNEYWSLIRGVNEFIKALDLWRKPKNEWLKG